MATAAQSGGASASTGQGGQLLGLRREGAIELSLPAFLILDALLLATYGVAVGGYLIGVLDGSPLFPLITNAIALYLLLLCCAALALADVRRFRPLLLFIAVAHLIQAVCLVLVATVNGLSGDVSILQLFDLPAAALFWIWIVYALSVAALFLALYRWAPRAELPMPFERQLGWQEWLLRGALAVMGLVFIAFVVFYVVRGIEGEASFAFVATSVSKDALFLALTVFALALPPRWSSLTMVVVAGHLVLVLSNALLWSSVSGPAPVFGADAPLGGDGVDVLRNWLISDVLVSVVLLAALWIYQRARYRLDYPVAACGESVGSIRRRPLRQGAGRGDAALGCGDGRRLPGRVRGPREVPGAARARVPLLPPDRVAAGAVHGARARATARLGPAALRQGRHGRAVAGGEPAPAAAFADPRRAAVRLRRLLQPAGGMGEHRL
jgi:hypothetical protein